MKKIRMMSFGAILFLGGLILGLQLQGISPVYAAAGFWQAFENKIYNTNSGGVGIGTNRPTDLLHLKRSAKNTYARLRIEVDGAYANQDAYLLFSDKGEEVYWSAGADDSLDTFRISNSKFLETTTRLLIDSRGFVGLGTDAPLNPLHLVQSGQNARAKLRLEVEGDKANQDASVLFSDIGEGVYWNIGADDSLDTFRISNSNSLEDNTRMLIDANGNIGIGTTSPSEKLHVQGDMMVTGDIQTDGDICIGSC